MAEAKIPLVPQIMVAGGGAEGHGNGQSLVNVLLANLVSKDLKKDVSKLPNEVKAE